MYFNYFRRHEIMDKLSINVNTEVKATKYVCNNYADRTKYQNAQNTSQKIKESILVHICYLIIHGMKRQVNGLLKKKTREKEIRMSKVSVQFLNRKSYG